MNTNDKKRARFPAGARLHKSHEYKTVINSYPVAKGNLFYVNSFLHNNVTDITSLKTSRIGLIFSKKMAHRAVVRNSLKRVVRESFRANANIIPKGDYVVRLRSKAPICSLRVLKKNARSEINYHFSKISKCTKK
ncbi:ribonuclease P protein component [Candidatus Kinetoplastidibacterium crithidiae]|uniref:Ribonuclease P protein component n=1 Tax=Candidatus Kinetoplastidibacterium crithidiae TCC036E TaxID=1208918 RepID=M1LVB1_9PROT|nr:ribonuclease P protein component [Candidatus Kinetoplastibacterium crithidii]AFZ83027.1 ribonuclease P [Candidatus Kinetoplastibacterium crithidii (ex Angomonas deanei ATCC 30255)]AGF48031.1 ribonuclease P protein component [Candidatus Kinetoplastibacterium crithidii TCC036E]